MNQSLNRNPSRKKTNIKLPKLNISKFYRDIVEWLSFWSAFVTTVHKNDSLNLIDKFNYLQSFLVQTH